MTGELNKKKNTDIIDVSVYSLTLLALFFVFIKGILVNVELEPFESDNIQKIINFVQFFDTETVVVGSIFIVLVNLTNIQRNIRVFEKFDPNGDQMQELFFAAQSDSSKIVPTIIFDLDYISTKIQNSKTIRIFIGLKDENLVHLIIDRLTGTKDNIVFVNPRIIDMFTDKNDEMKLDFIKSSPCSLECCTIFFEYKDNSKDNECIVIRKRKSSEDGEYWVTSVKDGDRSSRLDYLRIMNDTYFENYEILPDNKVGRRYLVSSMDLHLSSAIAKKRIVSDSEINSGKYNINSRNEQYELATYLVEKSRKSILAIDATTVNEWNHDDIMENYLSANRVAKSPTKKRVHIFDSELLKGQNFPADYLNYIELMKAADFNNIRFVENPDSAGLDISKIAGVVIIDDEACFYATRDKRDLQIPFEGWLSTNNTDIEKYKIQFNKVFNSNIALTAEEFEIKYLK